MEGLENGQFSYKQEPSQLIDQCKAGLRCAGLLTDGHFRRGDPVWSCPTPLLSLLQTALCLEWPRAGQVAGGSLLSPLTAP